jgi:hypothetical protein
VGVHMILMMWSRGYTLAESIFTDLFRGRFRFHYDLQLSLQTAIVLSGMWLIIALPLLVKVLYRSRVLLGICRVWVYATLLLALPNSRYGYWPGWLPLVAVLIAVVGLAMVPRFEVPEEFRDRDRPTMRFFKRFQTPAAKVLVTAALLTVMALGWSEGRRLPVVNSIVDSAKLISGQRAAGEAISWDVVFIKGPLLGTILTLLIMPFMVPLMERSKKLLWLFRIWMIGWCVVLISIPLNLFDHAGWVLLLALLGISGWFGKGHESGPLLWIFRIASLLLLLLCLTGEGANRHLARSDVMIVVGLLVGCWVAHWKRASFEVLWTLRALAVLIGGAYGAIAIGYGFYPDRGFTLLAIASLVGVLGLWLVREQAVEEAVANTPDPEVVDRAKAEPL